jgi:hypothetical protein
MNNPKVEKKVEEEKSDEEFVRSMSSSQKS